MRKRLAIVAVVVLSLTAAGTFLLRRDGADARAAALAASGTVEAMQADVGFPLAGRIDSLAVREGDRVRRGQELARLDRAELEARLASAQARVAAAEARLAELRTGARAAEVEQARAARAAAARRLADARRDLGRTRRLFEGGAVSRESWERAQTALEIARSEHDRASAALRLVEDGPRAETIAAQLAAVRQARAAAAQVEATLGNTVLRAPFDGVVTVRHRDAGEIVGPGAPVVTVMDTDDRWVRIYVREDRVGAVALGQRAVIRGDTYRDRSYEGEVVFIASEAEFTPRNVQTREERVKLVYAVKVAITGDASHELKPGLPVDVDLLAGEAARGEASGSTAAAEPARQLTGGSAVGRTREPAHQPTTEPARDRGAAPTDAPR